MVKRTILHVDLNSFFASVEQQANPYLRNKPVGILKDVGRTCVIACSNEAKMHQVTTGMSLSQARALCPQIILVPADFGKYEVITKKFFMVCSSFTDLMEIFSLDEVFLDVTYSQHLWGNSLLLAFGIQERLKVELGEWIGCSIGIAENKLLAKIASGVTQKKSVFVVTDKNKQELLSEVPFIEVCGIGYRLSKRLKVMGITKLPQITAIPFKLLKAEFGHFWANKLKRLALGEDETPVNPTVNLPDAKSVSRTFTLFKDTNDAYQIRALISNLVEEAAFKLRRMNLTGRQFGLTIRGGHLSQSGYLTGKTYTNSGRFIFKQLFKLYNSWRWSRAVRFAGVWVSLLTRENNLPLPLLEEDKKQLKLNQALDRVNDRYGMHALHPANMMGESVIRPEINGYLGDKKFRLGNDNVSLAV